MRCCAAASCDHEAEPAHEHEAEHAAAHEAEHEAENEHEHEHGRGAERESFGRACAQSRVDARRGGLRGWLARPARG